MQQNQTDLRNGILFQMYYFIYFNKAEDSLTTAWKWSPHLPELVERVSSLCHKPQRRKTLKWSEFLEVLTSALSYL